jgi:hypothetical protein
MARAAHRGQCYRATRGHSRVPPAAPLVLAVRQRGTVAFGKAVLSKDNPADLINVAPEELVRARCELPGYTTLDAIAATIRTGVSTAFYR